MSRIDSIYRKVAFIKNVILRNNYFSYKVIHGKNNKKAFKIIGMVRLRNEELVLHDTLNHLSQFVDGIIIFDDHSTDHSAVIAKNHPSVIEIIVNKRWRKSKRIWEETANRRLLYHRAKKYNPEWFFYSDADERFEGNIRQYLLNECPDNVEGVRIALYDAYITPRDKNGYTSDKELFDFRKYFGIERRDILMIWRNRKGIDFKNMDAREPQGINGLIKTKFYCQHYGKSISIQQWEDTCKYYAENFPLYSQKWKDRMGKAIHQKSDFGTNLLLWKDVKKSTTYI